MVKRCVAARHQKGALWHKRLEYDTARSKMNRATMQSDLHRNTVTPLLAKIVTILNEAGSKRMSYHDLMLKLWPPADYPRAWRYSSNGGPPGCAIAFGRAVGQLRRLGMVYERIHGRRREICLSGDRHCVNDEHDQCTSPTCHLDNASPLAPTYHNTMRSSGRR